jgi:hypothetical protein
MSVADNFDYSIPSIPKGNTMYLSTINKNDAIIRPFKKMYTQRDWSANLYNLDIESSMPRRFGVFTNKVDFINKVDDIERTNPKILHYPLNKPEYNLTNKDIEKSSPQMEHLKTKRCTNPLQPKYNLPKVEEYPADIPKFIRDSIDISDITGARPQKYFPWKTRETFPLDNHGIEGTKTKKTYVRKKLGNTKYHYIDYSDLTRDIFKTKRNTNPLDPIYGFKKNEDIFKYGPIEKSKPQTNSPFFYQPILNLKLDDIQGTNVGSKNKINKFNGNNYELITHDIKGCNVGSLKKGIVTQRCTNPLAPEYQYLGATEFQGSKLGEYSKSKRAKSVANSNNTSSNNNEINSEHMEKPQSPKMNANEPKMVSINDIDKQNINNNFEEQKNENNSSEHDLGREIPNNNIDFDRNVFGKKPDPNFGLSHDPYVQSSDNPEKLKEIEKMKKLQFTMSKTSTSGFFNGKNKNNGISQYQNNPNLSNFNQKFNKNNNKLSYGNNIANNLGGVGSLNIDGNINGNENISNEIKRMNKTSFGFRPFKKTYEEKLDNFMANHNLKYIEQQKKSIQDGITSPNKGKNNNLKKTPENTNNKLPNNKK